MAPLPLVASFAILAPSLLPLLVCSAAKASRGAGRPWATGRRLVGTTDAASKSYISCSEQDLLYVIQRSAEQLADKFVRAMDDLQLIQQTIVAENSLDGARSVVLSANMSDCSSSDWSERRSSPWGGYMDSDPNRTNELWYGSVARNNTHGVFRGTRNIDTDLAFLRATSNIFPWVVNRQRDSFDMDAFYDAAWIGTSGEVWSYYPGFNQIWPGHCFGDALGPDYNGREDIFVAVTRPEYNPERKQVWTPPYADLIKGLMISATMPVYFDGNFRGHRFYDEYVAATGIDITLNHMEPLMTALKPTAGALPMILDDEGRLISAPPHSVAAIFGQGASLLNNRHCGREVDSQHPTCSINTSSSADWTLLVAAILSAERGSKELAPALTLTREDGSKVLYTGGFYRWKGREAPLWNSVVLVPVDELQRSARLALPRSLEAVLDDPTGISEATFLLTNEGLVDLTYHLVSWPAWLVIVQPANETSAVDGPTVLAAGAHVRYVVRLEGSKTDMSGGTVTASMSWAVADDDYPDCTFKEAAVLQVTLRVPVHEQKWIMPLVVSMAAIIAFLIVGLGMRFLYKRRQQLLRLRRAKEKHDEEQLRTADKAMRVMAFPIHLVLVSVFCKLQVLLEFEVLRDQRRLKVLDYLEDVIHTPFFFLSHQWTAWDHPDHTGHQFRQMRSAVIQLAGTFNWHFDYSFVWVDYCCIPQRHPELQQLAILSLPIYAAYATVFVIVAPDVEHSNTLETCNVESYMTRAWCRAEQTSHVVSRGINHMYCTTCDGQVQLVDRSMVKTALHVFDGSLTCCRKKHKGIARCDKENLVLPLLGVYAKALRTKAAAEANPIVSGRETFLDTITAEGVMFPAHFDFETETGVERRELFGDLVAKMKNRVSSNEDNQPFPKVRMSVIEEASSGIHGQSSANNLAVEDETLHI